VSARLSLTYAEWYNIHIGKSGGDVFVVFLKTVDNCEQGAPVHLPGGRKLDAHEGLS